MGEVKKPLGGVHPRVLEGNRTPNNGFLMRDTMAWGVIHDLPFQLPKSWSKQLPMQESLRDIRHRLGHEEEKRIVSSMVEGIWRVGALDLDRDDVHDLLEERGYTFQDDLLVNEGSERYLVEFYRRSSE